MFLRFFSPALVNQSWQTWHNYKQTNNMKCSIRVLFRALSFIVFLFSDALRHSAESVQVRGLLQFVKFMICLPQCSDYLLVIVGKVGG